MSCKFLTGFLVVVEVKIWSVEIGADLVQMKSEFPEASFLQGFLRVFLVQMRLAHRLMDGGVLLQEEPGIRMIICCLRFMKASAMNWWSMHTGKTKNLI